MKQLSTLSVLAGLVLFAACGRKPVDDTVVWSELRSFDFQAERAEARVNAGVDADELEAISKSVIASAKALLDSGVPPNVVSRSEVDARLEDIRDLLGALEEEPGAPDVLKAFHPVVHDLMVAAGMPHVHDHAHEGDCCPHDEPDSEHDHHYDRGHGHDPDHEHAPGYEH
jgi:ABC-type nickel/cobalt efflux system permease component RcnA